MRSVDKSAVQSPGSLERKNGRAAREYAASEAVYLHGAEAEVVEFKAYKNEDVKNALEELFFKKCAYCECFYAINQPVDVEHFRPKGAIKGDEAHPGYWWLAMKWENLLPSCIDCNRRRKHKLFDFESPDEDIDAEEVRNLEEGSAGKKDIFPIDGVRAKNPNDDLLREKALLLQPCIDEPTEHLVFSIHGHWATVAPRTLDDGSWDPKGKASIEVYGLNRISLVQARTEKLMKLKRDGEYLDFFLTTATRDDLPEDIRDEHIKKAEQTIEALNRQAAPDSPFSEVARVYIAFLKTKIEVEF